MTTIDVTETIIKEFLKKILPHNAEREFSPVRHPFAVRPTIEHSGLLNFDFVLVRIRSGEQTQKTIFNVSKIFAILTQKLILIRIKLNDASGSPYVTISIEYIKTYVHFLINIVEDVTKIANDLNVLGHCCVDCCSCC